MIIQIPEEKEKETAIKAYLDSKKITYKEEGINVE